MAFNVDDLLNGIGGAAAMGGLMKLLDVWKDRRNKRDDVDATREAAQATYEAKLLDSFGGFVSSVIEYSRAAQHERDECKEKTAMQSAQISTLQDHVRRLEAEIDRMKALLPIQ